MPKPFSYPCISVHPNKVSVYTQYEGFSRRNNEDLNHWAMPKHNFHANKISEQSRRKMSKAIDYLVYMATDRKVQANSHGKFVNFKVSFITLTLSSTQIHTDNEIKKYCLNQFIIEAKRKWNVHRYIWRAEKQGNGNIHFHIITDRFIPWSEVRNTWNRIQNKLGYVDRYRSQIKAFHAGGFQVREELLKNWSYKNQLKAYKEGKANDFSNPNSTDIHSLRLINDAKAYMMKYMVKDQQRNHSQVSAKSINYEMHGVKEGGSLSRNVLSFLRKTADIGRLWSSSYDLTNITGAKIIVDSVVEKELRSAFRKCKPKYYKGDHFSVIEFTTDDLIKYGANYIIKEFALYLLEKFKFHFSYYSLSP